MQIIFEIGMQQQKQLPPSSASVPKARTPSINLPTKVVGDRITEEGNEAANILAEAYKQFAKNGLTKAEIEKLEKVDGLFSEADIMVNSQNGNATITQNDGTTFNIDLPSGNGKKGKGR